jgi:hypothetical protein
MLLNGHNGSNQWRHTVDALRGSRLQGTERTSVFLVQVLGKLIKAFIGIPLTENPYIFPTDLSTVAVDSFMSVLGALHRKASRRSFKGNAAEAL